MGISNILHIYGQQHEHDSIYIVGNEQGLLILKSIIEKTLNNKKGISFSNKSGRDVLFTNDGEGFEIFIKKIDDQYNKIMTLPYNNKDYIVEDSDLVRPYTFFIEELKNNK